MTDKAVELSKNTLVEDSKNSGHVEKLLNDSVDWLSNHKLEAAGATVAVLTAGGVVRLLGKAAPEVLSTAGASAKELLPAASDLLPESMLDKTAIHDMATNLSHDIFSGAQNAEANQTLKFSSKGNVESNATADHIFSGDFQINVATKGVPEPIRLTGDSVTVTPSLRENAFTTMVLEPLIKDAITIAKAGRDPRMGFATIELPEIKLALENKEELTGALKLRAFLQKAIKE